MNSLAAYCDLKWVLQKFSECLPAIRVGSTTTISGSLSHNRFVCLHSFSTLVQVRFIAPYEFLDHRDDHDYLFAWRGSGWQNLNGPQEHLISTEDLAKMLLRELLNRSLTDQTSTVKLNSCCS